VEQESIEQAVLFSTLPLSGYYRFRDRFQLLIPDNDWQKPPYLQSHHPILVEYQATPNSSEYIFEIADLLSTLTNFPFFFYDSRQFWFIPFVEGEFENKVIWGQHGYKVPEMKKSNSEFTKPEGNAILKVETNGYYNNYAGRLGTVPISFPVILDNLLDKYHTLEKEARTAYRKASKMFQSGLSLKDTRNLSLAFAALVSSIETLVYFEYMNDDVEKCPECGQERYRVSKKFKDFMAKYGSATPQFKKYADEAYSIRSQILHRGHFLLSDVDPNATYLDDSVKLEHLIRAVRICLVNWLLLSNAG
jgi:hypothetical protein